MKRLYMYLAAGLLLVLPLVATADDDHEKEDEDSGSRPVEITEAKWKEEKSKLVVKGKGEKGETVTVTSSGGQLLGKVKIKKKEWKLKVAVAGSVPCEVRAEQSDGSHDTRKVKEAPGDCDNGGGTPPTDPPTDPPPTISGDFTVLAANDLGMHCADQDYRIFSILPPYNVLNAQVLRKGDEPEHMSPADGIKVTYRAVTGNIIDPNDPSKGALANDSINTTSENDLANGVYKANFWDSVDGSGDPLKLLGYLSYDNLYPGAGAYPPDGLLAMFPLRHPMMDYLLGLPAPNVEELYLGGGALEAEQATMPGKMDPYNANDPQPFHGYYQDFPFFVNFPFGYTVKDFRRFTAEGIPMTPVDDQGRKNAYPLMRVEARDMQGRVLAANDVVVPVASEADCQSCHLEAEVCTGLGLGFKCDDVANYYSNADFIDSGNINSDPAHQVPGDTPEQIALNASKINILRLHDEKNGTSLDAERTVVCANCHYSPALDLAHLGPNDDNGKEQTRHRSMSNVMHGYHASLPNSANDPDGVFKDLFPTMPTWDKRTPELTQSILEETCYACHPGKRTACLRGAMAEGEMVCQDCHGQGTQVGNDFTGSFAANTPGNADFGKRVPWASEPKCQSCHLGDVLQVAQLKASGKLADLLINGQDVWGNADGLRARMAYSLPEHVDNGGDTLLTLNDFSGSRFASDQPLYRLSGSNEDKGHGELFCEGCHGSTHAIWPNANPFSNDNRSAEGLQGHSGPITECSTCHTGDLGNTLEGPHGMHPVGNTRFSRGGHEHLAEKNKNACRACHGQNGEGTVLSRVAADRVLDKDDDGRKTIQLAKGTPVSCNLCHENKLK